MSSKETVVEIFFNGQKELLRIIDTGGDIIRYITRLNPVCPLIGSEIKLIDKLGKGAFGTVFLISFPGQGAKKYAVKRNKVEVNWHIFDNIGETFGKEFDNWKGHTKMDMNKKDFFDFNGVDPNDEIKNITRLYFPEFMENACKTKRTFKRADGKGKTTVPAGSLICQNNITEIIISLMAGEIARTMSSINFIDTFYFATCRPGKEKIRQYTFMEKIDTSLQKVAGYDEYQKTAGGGVQKIPHPPVYGKVPADEEIVSLYLQVVHGLAVLQNKFAIVHGDLHLDNVFVEKVKPDTMWHGESIINNDYLEFQISGHPSVYILVKETPYIAKIGDWGLSVKYPTKENNIVIGDQTVFEDGYDQQDGNGPWVSDFYSRAYDVAYFTARMHIRFPKNVFIHRIVMWMLGFDPDRIGDKVTEDRFTQIFTKGTGWRPNIQDGVLTNELGHVSPHAILTNPALLGKYLISPSAGDKVLFVASDSMKTEYAPSPKKHSPTKTRFTKPKITAAVSRTAKLEQVQRASASPKSKTGITSNMRRITVDWMLEVAEELKVTDRSFIAAVAILDLYLSLVKISRSELQVVACAATHLAYEKDVDVNEGYFDTMGAGNCSKAEQKRIKKDIIVVFSKHGESYRDLPNTIDFLDIYKNKLIPTGTRYNYAKYALFVAAFSADMLKYSAEQLAASAVILGRLTAIAGTDPLKDVEAITGLTLPELKPCLIELADLCIKTNKFSTVFVKFRTKKYNEAAKLVIQNQVLQDVLVRM